MKAAKKLLAEMPMNPVPNSLSEGVEHSQLGSHDGEELHRDKLGKLKPAEVLVFKCPVMKPYDSASILDVMLSPLRGRPILVSEIARRRLTMVDS